MVKTKDGLLEIIDAMADGVRPLVKDDSSFLEKVEELKKALIAEGVHLADRETQEEVMQGIADELSKYRSMH